MRSAIVADPFLGRVGAALRSLGFDGERLSLSAATRAAMEPPFGALDATPHFAGKGECSLSFFMRSKTETLEGDGVVVVAVAGNGWLDPAADDTLLFAFFLKPLSPKAAYVPPLF